MVQGGALNDGPCTFAASACCQVPTCATSVQVQLVSMCGSGTTLTSNAAVSVGTSMMIVSHNAGANYRDNSDCRLTVVQGSGVPAGWVLRLRFQSFYTEAGYDYLNIYDGPDASAALVFRDSGDIGGVPNARLPEREQLHTCASLQTAAERGQTALRCSQMWCPCRRTSRRL